jgi:predicted Zn-dependent protease with MMP-like domain
MLDISDEQFASLVSMAMDELPQEHMEAVKNVAIVYADKPTPEQQEKLHLRADQSLLGLYEGVPLTRRQGVTSYPPDKITLFKRALLMRARTYGELRAEVKHTLWHEIAHYFGLDHPAIRDLENKPHKHS